MCRVRPSYENPWCGDDLRGEPQPNVRCSKVMLSITPTSYLSFKFKCLRILRQLTFLKHKAVASNGLQILTVI